MDIGRVLSEAWGVYTRFFGRFFVTALVVFVVLDLVSAVGDRTAAEDAAAAAALWAILAAVISVAGSFWVQAALVELTRDVRDGRPDRSVADTYRAVQRRLPHVVLAGLVIGLAVGVGLVLLVVPGLYLLTIWSMAIPAIVLEGRSAGESFGRSRGIVRGNGLRVCGLVVITFLLVGLASGVIQALLSGLPGILDAWLGGVIAHSVTAPFAAAALTTAYFHLTARESDEAVATPASHEGRGG